MNHWLNRPTLITGASGLVGGWLTKALLNKNADVVCIVRDWVPQCELTSKLDRVKVVRGDITDQQLLERTLGEYEIDTVFHLAAQTQVMTANNNPPSTFESNIRGTWCLLEACRRSPLVKQIITASSDKAYGDSDKLPYDESTKLEGRHPYDVSKSCADLISQSYATTYDLPVAITRCGNFYGGGDLNWHRLVPQTIRSAMMGERPIIRSDGQYIRDFFYVEDGVGAYMLLAEKLTSDRNLIGHAFNFSSKEKRTVLNVVETTLNLMDSDLMPDIRNEVQNEIKEQSLDSSKARKMLNWEPKFSFAEGIKKTIDWYKNFLCTL